MVGGGEAGNARRLQHQRRMGMMPWLYFAAPPEIAAWARPWQAAIRAELEALERVRLDPDCFVAPDAAIFAEPGREVVVGPGSSIAVESRRGAGSTFRFTLPTA